MSKVVVSVLRCPYEHCPEVERHPTERVTVIEAPNPRPLKFDILTRSSSTSRSLVDRYLQRLDRSLKDRIRFKT